MIPLTALVPVLLMPLWPLARKRITVPRVGHVRFSQERANREKGKLKLFTMLGVGLFTMSAAAGVFFYFQMGEGSVDSLFGIIVPGLPCFLLGLMVVLGGSMIGRRQFTVYAIILVITGMAGIALEIEPFVQLVIGGGVMLLIGITLLIRFIQKYPIQKGTL